MPSIEENLTANDLLALVETSAELAARIDTDDLLHVILAKAGELSDSPDGALLLFNKERHSLYFAGAIGEDANMLLQRFGESSAMEIPVEVSKAGQVFSSGKSIIIDSVSNDDPAHYKVVDEETKRTTQSMLCVPLVASGERLGAMQLLNKHSGNYSERDRLLLEHFANYAAIAIRNARLFEEVIAHTGLYASRKFGSSTTELLRQLNSPARTEKLTILFADMRGFRLLCQIINNPEKILDWSSQFITMLSEQVLKHGGLVNKFLGDGILALFRQGDHARRAVKCAFEMLDAFSVLHRKWQENAKIDFLDIGIGITTDEVIIGTIGNAKVRDFTAIGTAVNLAAAFEHEARGGRHILVDYLTYCAVEDIVAEMEGPVDYELRQPDQRIGNIYSQYHLKRLRSAPLHTIFISHSHEDREFVQGMMIDFLDKNQVGHWYSDNDIRGGEAWLQKITDGLDACDRVVVVVSKSSAKSDWVKAEINMAAALPRLINKIIPLCIDDTKPETVHAFLRHKQAISVYNNNKFLNDLLRSIE